MSGGINRFGQRVDKFRVKGIKNEQRGDGSYILINGCLFKDVEHYTVTCPEDDCDGISRYDERFEPICQECGMVCLPPEDVDRPMVLPTDEFWSSRATGGATGIPAINDAHQRSEHHLIRRNRYIQHADSNEAIV